MSRDITLDEQMLVSALRYALGRSSYITYATAEQIRRVWGPRIGYAEAQRRRGERTERAEIDAIFAGTTDELPAIAPVEPYDGDSGYLSRNAKQVILTDLKRAIDAGDLGMPMDAALWETLYADLTVDDPHIQLRGAWVPDEAPGPDQGYPSEEELQHLSSFHGTTREYFEYVFSIWRNGSYKVMEAETFVGPVMRVELVTGGWSGCEDVISVVNQSLIGIMCAAEWHRGGLHVYEVNTTAWESAEPRELGTISRGEEDGRIPEDPAPNQSKEALAIARLRDQLAAAEKALAEARARD